MLKYLIRISTFNKKSASVLDFFAGSGTTAQAVVEINHEDDKDFNFHICQLDEPISPKSKQYEFAKNNNLGLTVDQLTVLRLKTVYEKMKKEEDFKIEILE
jgi:adenine-specific DNA-methyltransferase